MAKLTDIVIDSVDPPKLSVFWAGVLDGYHLRAYDQAEIDRLAQQGQTPATDPAVAIDGPGPTLFFQKTTQCKQTKNRVHLDVRANLRTPEVDRLASLGARVRDVHDGHTVMLDPEGNEFCVVDN